MNIRTSAVLMLCSVIALLSACTPGTYYPFGDNPNANCSCAPGQPAHTCTYEPPASDKYSKCKVTGF
jgi:hypothetical protein